MNNTRIPFLLLLLAFVGCYKEPNYPPNVNEKPLFEVKHLIGEWFIVAYKLTTIKDGIPVDSTERYALYDTTFYNPTTFIIKGEISPYDYITLYDRIYGNYDGLYEYGMADSTTVTNPINYLFSVGGLWKMGVMPYTIIMDLAYVKNVKFTVQAYYNSSFNMTGRYYDHIDRLNRELTLYFERQ